jgi:hypothetical protein
MHSRVFLVQQIEGSVDEGGGSVGGERHDLEGVHVLDVEVVVLDVGHHVSAGGEGGEHEAGGFGVPSSQLAEVSGGDVLGVVVNLEERVQDVKNIRVMRRDMQEIRMKWQFFDTRKINL